MAIRFSPPNKATSISSAYAITGTDSPSLATPIPYNQAKFYAWQGRINRTQYFVYPIIVTTIIIASLAIYIALLYYQNGMLSHFSALDFQSLPSGIMSVVLVLGITIALASLGYFHIAFTKRRLNDLNQSGWWSILLVVPVLGVLLNVYLLTIKGAPYYNRYGAPAAPAKAYTIILAILLPSLLLLGLLSKPTVYQNYLTQLSHRQVQANQSTEQATQENKSTAVNHQMVTNISTASNVLITPTKTGTIQPSLNPTDNKLKNNKINGAKTAAVDDLAIQQNVKPILVDNNKATANSTLKDERKNVLPHPENTHASMAPPTTDLASDSDKNGKNTKPVKADQALIEEAVTPIFTER